ncbi:hypothetical protein FRB94_000344 [Tulasnella sp. JGI-2019a]|nr:hypothetical protein FRB93_006657 [Tulasnella sp. JGI-2019a]KAG9006839.1 hypothetical protein FRB94_000344 [Tulasnella sp. JGI-2019a]
MIPLSHCWRSFGGASLPPSEALDKLRFQAPSLRNLHLQAGGEMTHVEVGDGVHLHRLDLTCVTIPWDSNRLSDLRSLSLAGLTGSCAPTLSQVVQILISSPSLEEVALCSLPLVATANDNQALPQYINLPNLISLKLYRIPLNAYKLLLSLFHFPLPSCNSIRLDSAHAPFGPLEKVFNHCTDGFIEQVTRVARASQFACVSFEDRTIELKMYGCIAEQVCWDTESELYLTLTAGEGDNSFNNMAAQMAELVTKALSALPLRIGASERIHQTLEIKLLSRFPSATRIKLPRRNCDGMGILQYLGQPCPNTSTG